MGAGVIDSDYTGPVKVLLFNLSDEDFSVSIGDRIAQLVIEKISEVDLVKLDENRNTERGSSGFGSTGIN